jgi:uncharacterized protein (TIGR00730 family)
MGKNICVYSSSSNAIAPVYFEAAEALGRLMARRGDTLVYGGGSIGLMGVMCRAVHEEGGHVIGVIPKRLRLKEVCYEESDELIVTETMRERKAVMEERSDAFIALPGGFGTLEEIVEILVLKQLGYHAKPVVFLNTNGFYDKLTAFFEHIIEGQFAKHHFRDLFVQVGDPDGALRYVDEYVPVTAEKKWFD